MSRLIKSQYTNHHEERKKIAVQTIHTLLQDKLNENNPEILKEASFIIQSAKNDADQMIQKAMEESSIIQQQIQFEKSNWDQEHEQLIEQAKQEGYAEGLELGRQEALRQYQSTIEESNQIIELSKRDYDEKIQSAENAILELSIKIAEKIIAAKLFESPNHFLPLVKKGLNEVKEYEHIKIHVHPLYYEFVLSQKDELRTLVTNDTDFYIYANAELNEHDCFIESAFGRIDVSIDTQLEQLKRKLLDLLG
ncbi:flagellar assembly protein FliH [Metabacillus niabensis]|uniref:flagellar assembly protein FliH n=1 Tax=Metabacillus niabensis TaxID=324854 RepID=UPI001CFBE911|nr:flagellar assembly protein FliH [Metabacillus niabensis]